MTREIKFRAWERGGKVMIDWLTMTHTAFNDKQMGGYGFLYRVMTGRPEMDVMQFTGLKDKNGKEIYEADIIKVGTRSELNGLLYSDLGFVIFSENVAAFGVEIPDGQEGSVTWPISHFVLNEFEVIGNIYENPELLQ